MHSPHNLSKLDPKKAHELLLFSYIYYSNSSQCNRLTTSNPISFTQNYHENNWEPTHDCQICSEPHSLKNRHPPRHILLLWNRYSITTHISLYWSLTGPILYCLLHISDSSPLSPWPRNPQAQTNSTKNLSFFPQFQQQIHLNPPMTQNSHTCVISSVLIN